MESLIEGSANLRTLVLSTPENSPNFVFDSESFIDEEKWQEIRQGYVALCDSENWEEAIRILASVALVSPCRFKEWPVLPKKGQKIVAKEIEHQMKCYNANHTLTLAVDMKIACPKIPQNSYWKPAWSQQICNSIHETYFFEKFDRYSLYTAGLIILDPKQRPLLPLNASIREKMLASINDFRKVEKWWAFLSTCHNCRILFPEVRFQLTGAEWKEVLRTVRNDQNVTLNELLEGTLYIASLAAEEVKTTECGLEIVMQKKKPEFAPIEPFPAIRQFASSI